MHGIWGGQRAPIRTQIVVAALNSGWLESLGAFALSPLFMHTSFRCVHCSVWPLPCGAALSMRCAPSPAEISTAVEEFFLSWTAFTSSSASEAVRYASSPHSNSSVFLLTESLESLDRESLQILQALVCGPFLCQRWCAS